MHIRASVATRCKHLGGPQVNKFEQVYRRCHYQEGWVEGSLYSKVQCHIGPHPTTTGQNDGHD